MGTRDREESGFTPHDPRLEGPEPPTFVSRRERDKQAVQALMRTGRPFMEDAWAAGVLDARGCMRVKAGKTILLRVTRLRVAAANALHARYGGSVTPVDGATCTWEIAGEPMRRFVRRVLPYLHATEQLALYCATTRPLPVREQPRYEPVAVKRSLWKRRARGARDAKEER